MTNPQRMRVAACWLRALTCCWLSACLWWPGAAHALDPSVRLSELHHTVWRSDNGAPANIVSLAQTPDGFLWLGTGAGLFRFDGVRFERITALGGEELLTTSITALHTTRAGALVIGDRFGGLSVFQDNRIRQFTVDDGLPGGNAWAFVQGEQGNLWAAFTGGVTRLRDGIWTTLPLDGEMLPYRTLVRDARGNVWVTAKTGAYVLPRGAAAFQRAAAALPLFPFLSLAPDGEVWAADFQRLGVKVGTVKCHMKSVMDKLQAGNRTETVVIATKRGLLALDRPAPGAAPLAALPVAAGERPGRSAPFPESRQPGQERTRQPAA